MFDILMYLFESYILGQINLKMAPDHLTDKLRKAGFRNDDILQAFKWLENLPIPSEIESIPEIEHTPINSNGFRIYSPEECTRLSAESRGFITMLETSGMIDSTIRESIIERALALDVDYLDVSELKLIVLMVLGARLDNDKEIDMLHELLLSEKSFETLH